MKDHEDEARVRPGDRGNWRRRRNAGRSAHMEMDVLDARFTSRVMVFQIQHYAFLSQYSSFCKQKVRYHTKSDGSYITAMKTWFCYHIRYMYIQKITFFSCLCLGYSLEPHS